GAVAGYEKALALEPANPYASYNFGKLRYERGALAEAERLLRQALRAKADFKEARVMLACALDAQGKPEAAAVELDGLPAEQRDFGTHFIHAGILRKLGRLDAAAGALRRARARGGAAAAPGLGRGALQLRRDAEEADASGRSGKCLAPRARCATRVRACYPHARRRAARAMPHRRGARALSARAA